MKNYVTSIHPVSVFYAMAREPGIANGYIVQSHEVRQGGSGYNSLMILKNPTQKISVVLGSKGLYHLPPGIAQSLTQDEKLNFAGASFSDDGKVFAILLANGSSISIARTAGGDRAAAHVLLLRRYQSAMTRTSTTEPALSHSSSNGGGRDGR